MRTLRLLPSLTDEQRQELDAAELAALKRRIRVAILADREVVEALVVAEAALDGGSNEHDALVALVSALRPLE